MSRNRKIRFMLWRRRAESSSITRFTINFNKEETAPPVVSMLYWYTYCSDPLYWFTSAYARPASPHGYGNWLSTLSPQVWALSYTLGHAEVESWQHSDEWVCVTTSDVLYIVRDCKCMKSIFGSYVRMHSDPGQETGHARWNIGDERGE